MKVPYCHSLIVTLFILGFTSCQQTKTDEQGNATDQQHDALVANPKLAVSVKQAKPAYSHLLPKGFILFEKLTGDLNNDGLLDSVLIVKATDKAKKVEDRYGKMQDRNRRGIIILFNKKKHYELALQNLDCFSSENEDGGVYFAPDLMVEIDKGNLYVHYGHGRYGYWRYTFKYRKNNFVLIGYDTSDHRGPVINRETSINFLTLKKQERVNTNPNAESGEEVFEEKWTKIPAKPLIKLAQIKDFDRLNVQD